MAWAFDNQRRGRRWKNYIDERWNYQSQAGIALPIPQDHGDFLRPNALDVTGEPEL